MAPNSFKNTPATNQFQRPSDSNSQDQFSVIDLLLIAVIGQEKKQLKGNKDSFWLISSKGCMLSVEGRQDSEGLRSRSVRSQEAESSASSFFFSQFIGWVNPQCRPMFLRCASLEIVLTQIQWHTEVFPVVTINLVKETLESTHHKV